MPLVAWRFQLQASRLFFSCVTDGVTFSYSTNGGSSWTDADYVVINENTDLLVKATKGGNSATSATLSFLAGNTLVLNNPTITKRSYSAGNYIVRITSDQSGLEIDPNSLAAGSSVKYKIGDGATQTYSGDVNVPEGNTLTAWVEATGYTTSDEVECVTEARPVGAEVWTQDYTSVVAGTTNACGVVLSTTTGGDFTVDDTPYYNIVGYTKDAATVDVDLNTNIGLAVSTNFNLRNNGSNSGILQNGSNQNIGFQNLKVGDIIIITTNGNALSGGTGMTLLGNMSTTSEYVFRATATEGAVRFNWGTYAYVKTITVERATVSPAIGPDGYATYSSPYALDFEHATGVKGYYATSVSGNTAVMTKITGTAAAGEGLFLQKTDGEISIPVVTTGTTLTGNLLKATDGNAIPASTASIFNYVFAKQSDELGFYKVTADLSDVAKGKAYLQTTTALTTGVGARMAFSFEDETTGINAVQGSGLKVNGSEAVYNLQGQRVAQPTKGLYIMNGKKVIMK